MTYQTFRAYQNRLLRDMIRKLFKYAGPNKENKYITLVSPTGSGKTLIARVLSSHVLKNHSKFGITKVLITAPQTQIRDGFQRDSGHWGVDGSIIELEPVNTEGGSELASWINNPNSTGVKLTCVQNITSSVSGAYNALNEMNSCENILWFFDEAHHSNATNTKEITQAFLAKGGTIVYSTATPFDANDISNFVKDHDRVIFRSLGEHMHEGECPQLDLAAVYMEDCRGDIDNIFETKQHYSANDASIWVPHLYKRWTSDEKGKALICIPSVIGDGRYSNTRACGDVIAQGLIAAAKLDGLDIKILNCIGVYDEAELEYEINVGDRYDFIISCARFNEGTDVKSISLVYNVGFTSDRLAIQRAGRALRDKRKISWYTEKYPNHIDTCKFVFFFPKMEIDANEKVDIFAKKICRVTLAMENFQEYQKCCGATRTRNYTRKKIVEDQDRLANDLSLTEDERKELEENIQIREEIEQAFDEKIKDHSLIDEDDLAHNFKLGVNGATVEEAMEHEGQLTSLHNQTLNKQAEIASEEEMDEDLVVRVKKARREGRSTKDAMDEFFSEMLQAFKDEKVEHYHSNMLETVAASLTGSDLKRFANMCSNIGNGEEAQMEMAKKSIEWSVKNDNKIPPSSLQEGQWLQNVRMRLLGTGSHYPYSNVHALLKFHFGEWLDARVKFNIDDAIEQCIQHSEATTPNTPPKHGTSLRIIYNRIIRELKINSNTKNTKKFNEYYIKQLTTSKQELDYIKALSNMHKCIAWSEKNNKQRPPDTISEGQWLMHFLKSIKGKGTGIVYVDIKDILVNYYGDKISPDLYYNRALSNMHKCIAWSEKNNKQRPPKEISEGAWLCTYIGNVRKNRKTYPNITINLKSYYGDIFSEIVDIRKEKALTYANEAIIYSRANNGALPPARMNNNWLYRYVSSVKGNSNRLIIYPEVTEVLKSYYSEDFFK